MDLLSARPRTRPTRRRRPGALWGSSSSGRPAALPWATVNSTGLVTAVVVNPVPVARLDMPDFAEVGGQVSVGVQLLTAGYGGTLGWTSLKLGPDR